MALDKVVKKILLTEWDPIGIKDDPNAVAEYDSYALRIIGMLYNGSSVDELADYLNMVTTEHMELPKNIRLTEAVARKLISLKLGESWNH